MLDQAQGTAEEIYERAAWLRNNKRHREAAELFAEIFAGRHGALDEKRIRHAYAHALYCTTLLRNWPLTEAIAREAIARIPLQRKARPEQVGRAYAHLGEALMRQLRLEEAHAALAVAIELEPEAKEARLLLELLRTQSEAAPRPPKVAVWPGRQKAFEDPRQLIERYLLRAAAPVEIVRPDSAFMTLGSCFAQNLARRLQAKGHEVHWEDIGEEVNSTYANRYLLDWIENGVSDQPTAAIEAAYGSEMRQRLRAKVEASNVFVMTLGVAPCFFRRDTGEFAFIVSNTAGAREHLHARHLMRTTDVSENVENIGRVISSIRRLAPENPKIVLTVSPVPLGGTTEFDSAIIADCISKSTLRLACHQVCSQLVDRDVVYWPSFEIVRWLGPHFSGDNPPVYGADDGNTRHVSTWIIEMIIDLFLEHHAAASA